MKLTLSLIALPLLTSVLATPVAKMPEQPIDNPSISGAKCNAKYYFDVSANYLTDAGLGDMVVATCCKEGWIIAPTLYAGRAPQCQKWNDQSQLTLPLVPSGCGGTMTWCPGNIPACCQKKVAPPPPGPNYRIAPDS